LTTRYAQWWRGPALVALTAAFALWQSWQRWLHPLIDTGRDLYIPERLLQGARLYRDIRYQYPPLTPYLLAGITRMIGSSLAAYTAIGIAQSIAICLLLALIARKLAGPLAASVVALLFVAINLSGFIFPYTYAATIGMAFLLAAYACVVYERPWLAVVFAVLASWCKVEYAVAALIVMLVVPRLAATVVALNAALFAVAAWHWRDNIFPSSLTSSAIAHQFYAKVSGRDQWLTIVGEAVLVMSAIAITRSRQRWLIALGIAVTLFIPVNAFFRAWGIAQFALLGWAWARQRALLTPVLFSIAATLRIPFNTAPEWYGLVLVLPLYVLIACVLFKRPLWLPLVAALCLKSLYAQHLTYAGRDFPIHSARGTFYDWNRDRADAINAFLARAHGGTLVVFPEGLTLNYLAGMRTPLTFHTFTPIETADRAIESRILGELQAHRPDRIVIVSRNVREFGYEGFGIDYDRRLLAWVRLNYRVEFRRTGGMFDITAFY
jgi:hypothetical protein